MVVDHLQALGHEVDWVGEWPEDPGDEEILARAVAENRVIITLDKDFGELAIRDEKPHRGIVRLTAERSSLQPLMVAGAIRKYESELLQGAFVTIERHRVRVRHIE